MELTPAPQTAKGPAENFTGDVYLDPIRNDATENGLFVAYVRFTPGARTNWHSHANGQLLRCVDSVGLVGTRDVSVVRMQAGDAVWTPPGEEHWHGGTAETMMSHYAILVSPPDGGGTTWGEPVTEEQYRTAQQG